MLTSHRNGDIIKTQMLVNHNVYYDKIIVLDIDNLIIRP